MITYSDEMSTTRNEKSVSETLLLRQRHTGRHLARSTADVFQFNLFARMVSEKSGKICLACIGSIFSVCVRERESRREKCRKELGADKIREVISCLRSSASYVILIRDSYVTPASCCQLICVGMLDPERSQKLRVMNAFKFAA